MRMVISSLHYEWTDIAHCLGRARDAFGLDGVELSWHASLARPHCTEEDFRALAELRGDHGLHLSAHLWEDLARLGPEAGAEALRRWLRRCEDTGVTTLILHGGSAPDRRAGIERTRQALHALHGDLSAAGVTVCLENHYAYDYRDCHELLSEPWEFQAILSPHLPSLAFCFDTGHGHMTRNWRDLLVELAPWLRYVHLADNCGEADDHLAFRQGTVPWNAMLTLLHQLDFDGVFCVEFPVRHDPGPFRECMAEIRAQFMAGAAAETGEERP